jgi:hypothetical protein
MPKLTVSVYHLRAADDFAFRAALDMTQCLRRLHGIAGKNIAALFQNTDKFGEFSGWVQHKKVV